MQPVSFSEKEHRPEIHGSWMVLEDHPSVRCVIRSVVTFTMRTYELVLISKKQGDIMGIVQLCWGLVVVVVNSGDDDGDDHHFLW